MDGQEKGEKVFIVLENSIRGLDGEHQEAREMLVGDMEIRKGARVLHYREQMVEDGQPEEMTDVYFHIRPDAVMLLRKGPFSMSMVFRRGQPYEGSYHTPFGSMPLRLHCSHLKCEEWPEGGSVEVRYQLNSEGGGSSHHVSLRYAKRPMDRG